MIVVPKCSVMSLACIISCLKREFAFMPMQELFGPLSMRALEEDKYVRQIEGYLPYAKVAFIDEIFKANSAILNTLLTILNERLFDNGSARIKVPLICLVSSLPALFQRESVSSSPQGWLFYVKHAKTVLSTCCRFKSYLVQCAGWGVQ